MRALNDFGRRLGTAMSGFVSIFNPDIIVLDGRISEVATPVIAGIDEALARTTQPLVRSALAIAVGELGSTAVAVGAATLVRDAWVRDLLRRRD